MTVEQEKEDTIEEDIPETGIFDIPSDPYLMRVTKKDGVRHGLTQIFQGAQLIMDLYYENDKANGPSNVYYPDGKIQIRSQYMNDILEGEFKVFHPNGSVQTFMTYKEGLKQGPSWVKDEYGNLLQESFYVDDLLHGDIVTYYNGDEVSRIPFKQGIQINQAA
jgi:uncharacterized protein